MKSFELYEPTGVSDAVNLLNKFGPSAKVLGGGSDLVTGIMKDWVQGKGMPYPEQIIDLTTIVDLKGIKMASDGAHIGATTSYDPVRDNFTKCDLCYWREGGPACVDRCPVNVRIRQGILKVEAGRMCLDLPKVNDKPTWDKLRAEQTFSGAPAQASKA